MFLMYSQIQICTKAHAVMVSMQNINLLSRVWPFCRTNSLENHLKWPFSPLKIDLISLLLSVEKGAFYIMDPMRGSCKLDLSTSGYY